MTIFGLDPIDIILLSIVAVSAYHLGYICMEYILKRIDNKGNDSRE